MSQENQKKNGLEKDSNSRSIKTTKIIFGSQDEMAEGGLRSKKQAVSPFLKSSLAHGKWVAIFELHLGMLEQHVETLDQLMQSMKDDAQDMKPQERLDWEFGEKGHWRVICRMMDGARAVLAQAREAARGILPVNKLQDKKRIGLKGRSLEKLEAQLQAKAESIGFNAKGRGEIGKSSSSAIDHHEDVCVEPIFQQDELVKKPSLSTSFKKAKIDLANDAEISLRQKENYEPTGSRNNSLQQNRFHKNSETNRARCEKIVNSKFEGISSAVNSSAESSTAAIVEKDIDFNELQVKLQEEIAAGEKAVQEARKARFKVLLGNNTGSKDSTMKKRRRSISDFDGRYRDGVGVRMTEKKRRKEKKEIKKTKKRKLHESEVDKEPRHGKKKKLRKS